VGQFDRAIGSELKCLRRAPKNFWARVILGWAYEQKRMFPEALAELREAVKLTDGAAFTVAAYGQALAASGDRRGALDVLAQLKQKSQKGYVSGFDVALIYAALGENDRAFRYLDQAERDHASMLPYITWDRRADSLRADPRYRIVLQKLALPAATLPPSTRAALAQKPAVGQ
jgi:tetratricopeptide (TPR) repeat protein